MTELAKQLQAAGIGAFPCRSDKSPAVQKGESWRDVARQPAHTRNWTTALVGVPIPEGSTVIDLDTYKGVTRQQVEQWLGCSLPWDAALLQRTQNGGEHYAFAVDWEVAQGSDIGIKGLDTRTAGKGYICTGGPYLWEGFGLMRLAHPATALPRLPDACRAKLAKVHTAATGAELPRGDRNIDLVRNALRHIDADCPRQEWVTVGMALKHHFHDQPDIGFAIFEEWSQYAEGRLDYDTIGPQWESFKAKSNDGVTATLGSIIHKATKNGFAMPAGIDTAAAFGGGAGAAPIDVFGDLVDQVEARGGDPRQTGELLTMVQTANCSAVQRAMLTATLQRALKDAGLLTAEIKTALSGKPARATVPGEYGKNHTENAALFLDGNYPDGKLLNSAQVWYAYDGVSWKEYCDAAIGHQLFRAMSTFLPQDSDVAGTYKILQRMAFTPRQIGDSPSSKIMFSNGILDLDTGQMGPHTHAYFTTNLLPYRYEPIAACGIWLSFLGQVFEDDQERIALLQEWMGYLLTSSYAHQKILLLLGPGRCGKGTIGRVLEQVVGHQNYSGGSLESFSKDPYLESLRNKTVVFIGDAEKRISKNSAGAVTANLKMISGADAVTFSRKYKSTLTETLPSRITIAANHVPTLFDDSGALANRFLVLPFDVSFAGREDICLSGKLTQEIEGIAAWALEGLRRLNSQGRFTVPAASAAETKYISESYSPLEQFIEEVCLPADGQVVDCVDVYSAYQAWALAHQEERVLARRTFVSAFKDATRGRFRYGPHRKGADCVRGFRGLALALVSSPTAGAFTAVK